MSLATDLILGNIVGDGGDSRLFGQLWRSVRYLEEQTRGVYTKRPRAGTEPSEFSPSPTYIRLGDRLSNVAATTGASHDRGTQRS